MRPRELRLRAGEYAAEAAGDHRQFGGRAGSGAVVSSLAAVQETLLALSVEPSVHTVHTVTESLWRSPYSGFGPQCPVCQAPGRAPSTAPAALPPGPGCRWLGRCRAAPHSSTKARGTGQPAQWAWPGQASSWWRRTEAGARSAAWHGTRPSSHTSTRSDWTSGESHRRAGDRSNICK